MFQLHSKHQVNQFLSIKYGRIYVLLVNVRLFHTYREKCRSEFEAAQRQRDQEHAALMDVLNAQLLEAQSQVKKLNAELEHFQVLRLDNALRTFSLHILSSVPAFNRE